MQDRRPGFFMVCANERETELIAHLNRLGVRWKEVQGCYKGIPERAFLILDTHESIEGFVLEFASRYSQESYLKVDAECRTAWLVFHANNVRVRLGEFKRINQSDALQRLAYTFDPITGSYYAA